jgi:drug/metabolite transporter (DMT)-like permease
MARTLFRMGKSHGTDRESQGGAGDRASGITWAVATAVISGFAIWVNRFGVVAWSDAGGSLAYTTAKNLVAAVVIGVIVWKVAPVSVSMREVSRHWKGLTGIAVFGGAIPFALFFEGLARASSTQAAFIHKTLLLWVAALAIPLLGEKVRATHIVAIAALLGGQVALAGGVSGIAVGTGEMMILAATLLWSVEVIVAKRVLAAIPAGAVGLARMGGGALVLIVIGVVSGGAIPLGALGAEQLLWVIVTGGVLAGYVYTWMNALSLAPAIDVTAVLVGSVIITALLDAGPAGVLAAGPGFALIAGGVAVLIFGWRRRAVRV